MPTSANWLTSDQLKRLEIPDDDAEDEYGLSEAGVLGELAAREAAVVLIYHWEDHFEKLDAKARHIINTDVDEAVEHLNRWRDNLLSRPELFE